MVARRRPSDGRAIRKVAREDRRRRRTRASAREASRGDVAAGSTHRGSAAQLRAVLETAVDAIITIDGRGRIQSLNPATIRMFGYAASELKGRNVRILMPSPYREEHDGYLARYLRTGEKRIIGIGREVTARRKDGTVFPVDLAVSEVDRGTLFTGVIRDISDRKLAESRLREADRLASIGTLAAGLGHDMNNVLLPVRAHLNAASALAALPEVRDHLRAVQKSIGYLQQLADGLHFLAMDPETIDHTVDATDLRTWWSQTGAVLSKAVPKHVKVTIAFPAGLPKIAVAAHALTQAVLNLIVNAGEAIPTGRKRRQGHVRLWAELAPGGSAVRLHVADNGCGMSEEVKRRAFDMFFSTKPRGLGTGLGLAMVRRVVDRAQGSIEIETSPGKGTTFSLSFPAVGGQRNEGERPTALLNVADGRASSLVRHLLEVSGACIASDGDARGAHIWVLDHASVNLASVKEWRLSHPRGTIVHLGALNGRAGAEWQALRPVVVENVDDLDAIRAVLQRAMAN